MMKKVLVLSTRAEDVKILLWSLSRAGFENFVAGNPSKDKGIKFLPICKKYYPISEEYSFVKQSKEIVALIEPICKKENIDIILPSGFESVCFLSNYKELLNKFSRIMPVPEADTIDLLNNKWSFALFCKNKGISQPSTYLLEDTEVVTKRTIPLKFPLLTKPLCMTASQGIYRFDHPEGLYKYLTSSRTDRANILPIILQEFIPGEDIDVNAFSSRGKLNAWTIQKYLCISQGNGTPIRWLEFTRHPEVLKIGKQILKETNYTGPAHIDMRIDSRDGSVKVIEFNPRFWASTMASLVDGINFAKIGVEVAFTSETIIRPKYSNRLWGSFWKIPAVIIKEKDFKIIRFLPRFSLIQIRYMLENFLLNVVSSTLKKLLKKKLLKRRALTEI